MGNPTRQAARAPQPADLDFDLTQEIDLALADLPGTNTEPTLTQSDFDDIDLGIAPPQPRARRRG